eukprot:3678480-Prymnesium_polylepis.2
MTTRWRVAQPDGIFSSHPLSVQRIAFAGPCCAVVVEWPSWRCHVPHSTTLTRALNAVPS